MSESRLSGHGAASEPADWPTRVGRLLARVPRSYRWAVFGVPLLALLVFNAWLVLHSSQQIFAQQERSRFGLRVEARINTVLSLAKDIETGTRGYLLSGEQIYLAPYQKAVVGLNEQLTELGRELDRYPDSAESAAALYRSITAMLDQAQDAIAARGPLGENPEVQRIEPLLAAQKTQMDRLRASADALRERQSAVNVELDRELDRTRRQTQLAILVPSGLSILFAVLLWSLIVRDLRRAEYAARERETLLAQERRARGEAESASQARDDFVSAVSHELRTPLQTILGWTQVLQRSMDREGSDARTLAPALAAVDRGARELTAMVEELLDASRALGGQLALRTAPVELGAILRETTELARPAADAKRVALELQLEGAPLDMIGDAQRLRQIAANLIGNAVKFTPSGGRVTIRAAHVDFRLQLRVRDTGIGISPELRPLIFQRYVQGSVSTTRQHGGLGLGLAIVKHLVEMHGGQIEVDSDGPGHGSEFRVSFPVQAAGAGGESAAPASPARLARGGTAPPAPATGAVRLAGLRVLVVDDDADVRSVLELLLAEEGAQVIAVGSAGEALDELRRRRVDVVLSDIGMPDVDGYALARAVRAFGADSATPATTTLIALTAFSRAEDERRALDSGFDDHLGKPVELERLIAALAAAAR